MKRRIVCLITAFFMAMTLVAVPVNLTAYADTTATESVTLAKNDVAGATVKLSTISYVYNGAAKKPTPKVTLSGKTLKSGTDYTVSYSDNVKAGTGKVTIKGKKKYKGTKTVTFTIKPTSITNATVNTLSSSYDYSGTAITPVALSYKSKALQDGLDYTVTYVNNTYPGAAEYTVEGIGNFTGNRSGVFQIARVAKLAVADTTTTSIQIEWKESPNVTGYYLYVYNAETQAWELKTTVLGSENCTFTDENLQPATPYDYKIVPFVAIGTEEAVAVTDTEGTDSSAEEVPPVDFSTATVYKAVESDVLKTATEPLKVDITNLESFMNRTMTVDWTPVDCSGYQLMVSRASDFSKTNTKFTLESTSDSMTIKQNYNNTNYYVKIRAYEKNGDVTVYGDWSDVKSVKSKGNGWYTSENGYKYYYKNGKKLTGTRKIGGNPYYFSSTGVLRGSSYAMWAKVNSSYSKTQYAVVIDRTKNRACVYEGKKGSWKLKYYWKCSTGNPKIGKRTPKTSTLVPSTQPKLAWMHGKYKNYSCWYATRFYNRVFIHSILYEYKSKTLINDGRLGMNVSNGCVRLPLDAAKWVYDNATVGTRIIVF